MLASKSRDWHRSATSPLAMALTVSLCAQALLIGPADALSFISAKKSQLQTPMEAKLDDDSGPSTDTASGDVPEVTAAESEKSKSKKDSKQTEKETAKKTAKETSNKDEPVSLAPVSLGDDTGTDSPSQTSSNSASTSSSAPGAASDRSDTQYMKLHAETMGVAPKGPLDGDGHGAPTTLPSKSLKSEIAPGKGSLVDQASSVNLSPMALMNTDAEEDQKAITDLDCERAQISDLWEATLTRSQDIQFVVQKLMPSSDKSHTTTALMRMISSTLVSGVSAAAMMSPSPMTYASTQAGSQMIMNIMGAFDAKAAKKAQIDQGQAITLYKMVRDTADKVTETYRDYKKYVRRLDRAQSITADLQNMIQDARAGQDAAKQIEMEYTLSKSKGDIEEAVYDARRYRQSLIDLAGADAVNKLDQSLQDQMLAEKELEKKSQIAEKPIAEQTKQGKKTMDALIKLNNMVQPQQNKNANM
ncbi:MAG TPA: hypothetical protein EYN91_14165 [Candidatus Melainabacteria bacterium]|mgnify:CR=1 FL=1|jgi:hypothetical protein|nr:hypothetical protein [Candidatus Melainabacteria bacterium]HIN66656.1 hypothetical protein [Candidatus Obscuribacterales bacterium]